MSLVKVISLIQPWAILLALNEKGLETRSWQTKYRGELYIHASKKIDKEICEKEPFKGVLAKHGYTVKNMPTGVILAKSNLMDCQKIIEDGGSYACTDGHLMILGNEYEFGDYAPGRFAWLFKDIEMLKEPLPAKGQLSLWGYDLKGAKSV